MFGLSLTATVVLAGCLSGRPTGGLTSSAASTSAGREKSVKDEVPRLPPGVAEADVIQDVRSWNEIMEAEVRRKFGMDIFERLHEEARQLRQKQRNPRGKQ